MAVQPHLPGDASHLTVQERADMIESYAGVVDAQVLKSSIMRQFVMMHSLRGTDTKTIRRMGTGVLQGIRDADAGQEMEATPRNFDRAQVTVDTIILAREARALLNDFQSDINIRSEVGVEHGKDIGKLFDSAMLAMGIKAALSSVTAGVADGAIRGNQGRDLGDAFKSGKRTTLTAAGDELDPDALYTAFEELIVQLQEDDVDTDEMGLFLRPRQYSVLLNNDKLIDRDFSSDNGDFANGTIKTLMGVPLIKSNRLADPNVDLSILSAGGEYVLNSTQLLATGLIFHPKTLLGAETIPLTSNVWYNNERLAWYIDTYLAFGASVRRPDHTAAVFSFGAGY